MNTSLPKYSFLTITLLAMLFSFTFSALAQSTDSVFAKGNQCYTKGQYQQAIGEYLRIVKQGKVSSDLYYNLGNSYFKINQNALAILYYEKALKLHPAHSDARFNLRQANNKSVDKIAPLPEIFFKRWWKSWVAICSIDTWAQLSLVALFLLVASLVLFIRSATAASKVVSFVFIILFVLSFALSFTSGWYGRYKFKNETFAIVISPSTYVKSSPDVQGKDLFILHEGTKGKITEQIGDWYRLHIADGNEGWVKNEAIECI